jgi:hypothetical protein
MTLDEILDMWDKDSLINEDHLDKEAISTAKLHSKYVRFLMQHKMKLAALNTEYNTLRQKKFRWYRGEMSREELTSNNWDQWQGIKPLKNEMEEFLTGDNDLNKINIKIEYIKCLVDALESILKQISGRDWSIRNAIEFKKFISGS